MTLALAGLLRSTAVYSTLLRSTAVYCGLHVAFAGFSVIPCRIVGATLLYCIARSDKVSCMTNLLELIREKKAQIAQLQQELTQALAELTGDHVSAPPATAFYSYRGKRRGRKAMPHDGNGARAAGIIPSSSMGRAVEEMRENGKPLHVDEIIKRAKAKGHDIKKNTLIGNLSRYNKEKRVIYRAKPSVYGLIEWKKG